MLSHFLSGVLGQTTTMRTSYLLQTTKRQNNMPGGISQDKEEQVGTPTARSFFSYHPNMGLGGFLCFKGQFVVFEGIAASLTENTA